MPQHGRPAPKLTTVRGVELMHAGTWALSTGEATFTGDDLAAAIAAQACPAVHKPVLKLGHVDPRFDGEPACGWIDNMRLASSGWALVGDYTGLPAWLTETDADGNSVLASAYPHRSVEGCWDFRCQLGHTHPFVVTAVALLGVASPGIGTLTSLQDIAGLYSGIAAAGASNVLGGVPVTVTIRATEPAEEPIMPNPTPTMVAAAVSVDDLRQAFNKMAPWSQWITEIQLDPLQLIVCDDIEDEYSRVPVTINTDGTVTFGPPVLVEVTYVDVPGGDSDTATVEARATAGPATGRLVYASRRESRPAADRPVIDRPAASTAAPEPPAPPVAPVPPVPGDPAPAPPRPGPTPTDPTPPADPAATVAPALTTDPEQEASVSAIDDLRSRLDLPDNADEAAVWAALDEKLGKTKTQPEPTPEQPADPAAPPAEPAQPAPVPEPEPAPEQPAPTEGVLVGAAAKLPPGVVAIDEATLGELRRDAKAGAAARRRQEVEDRDRFIDAAVTAGKIPPGRREHWTKAFDADPDGTRATIDALAAGLVPVDEQRGYAGQSEPDEFDTEFRSLFPPEPATSTKGA